MSIRNWIYPSNNVKMFVYNAIDNLPAGAFDKANEVGKKLSGNENWFEDLRRVRIVPPYHVPTEAQKEESRRAREYWWPNDPR